MYLEIKQHDNTISFIPAINRIHIEEESGLLIPYILTKKLNGDCIAYKPESVDLIKQTTQYDRNIVKVGAATGGLYCE